eukprot:3840238-Alexandrium_andersonii.AAC.1
MVRYSPVRGAVWPFSSLVFISWSLASGIAWRPGSLTKSLSMLGRAGPHGGGSGWKLPPDATWEPLAWAPTRG